MLGEEIFLTFDKKFKDLKNEKDKIIKDMEEYNQFIFDHSEETAKKVLLDRMKQIE